MGKTFSPPVISVIANDTDTNLLQVVAEKSFKATGLRISNQNAAVSRVRIWDTFTDSALAVHTTAALPLPVWDAEVQPGETQVIDNRDGIFNGIGLLIAQASIAAAEPNHVSIGVSGEFEP